MANIVPAYTSGNAVRLMATVKDLAENSVNATGFAFKLKKPDQTIITVTDGIVNPSTGSYYYDYVFTDPGMWQIQAVGTSPTVFVEQAQVRIVAKSF